ncbi:TMV resistance protein N-like [Vicia villosa]|uniref:TMV resistance protein N-like n=1 Tax=Vicia villosa TaxID=3911 RepID=UPI00273BC1CE|nr:TMV resistance protein N-like [Vicia villosa]
MEEIKLVVDDCCSLVRNFKDAAIMFVGRKQVTDAHHLVGIGNAVGSRNWDGFLPSYDTVCNAFYASDSSFDVLNLFPRKVSPSHFLFRHFPNSSSSSKLGLPTMNQDFPETVWIHDVFLSFRGEDTRAFFTSHLCTALQNAGIKIFIDDNDLQRGDHISPSLSLAIQQSQISIIIFSTNYADSRWCLDELETMLKCLLMKQVVVPVFYHVDPSEVRHQKGEFGMAFQRLLDKVSNHVDFNLLCEKERRWRGALRQAADIAGFVIFNSR